MIYPPYYYVSMVVSNTLFYIPGCFFQNKTKQNKTNKQKQTKNKQQQQQKQQNKNKNKNKKKKQNKKQKWCSPICENPCLAFPHFPEELTNLNWYDWQLPSSTLA